MEFTIRDLLWLTLLAAVLVAWWVDRSRLSHLLFDIEFSSGPPVHSAPDQNPPKD